MAKYCKSFCYAIKHYKLYPDVRKAWDDNLRVAKEDRPYYFQSIRRYLLKNQPAYFRWHVAGDILDQHYYDWMRFIAEDFDFVHFVAFTKMYDLSFWPVPENLAVILSVCPGQEIPPVPLPLAFIDTDSRARERSILKCRGECEACRACWHLRRTEDNVLLKEI